MSASRCWCGGWTLSRSYVRANVEKRGYMATITHPEHDQLASPFNFSCPFCPAWYAISRCVHSSRQGGSLSLLEGYVYPVKNTTRSPSRPLTPTSVIAVSCAGRRLISPNVPTMRYVCPKFDYVRVQAAMWTQDMDRSGPKLL